MKRCLALLLSLLFCVSMGCTPPAEPEREPDARSLAAAVAQSQTDGEDLAELTGEVLTGYLHSLGLTEWEDAAVLTGRGMDAREITVLRLAGDRAADTAAGLLVNHQWARLADFFGYAPDEVALLEEALVLVHGCYAVFFACSDTAAAQEAFYTCLGGGVTEHVPAPTSQPTPEPEPSPTPVPEPEMTPAVLNPDLDISGFVPYDRPGDVDMTLYDHSAVVEAWNTGDESGLSDMDRAILKRCRQAFSEAVREGMTDAEVELALHDWLMANGAYDDLSRDNVAHIGRPNNTDPYGMLVSGYGICLGFAATFQLLMDLAGIECITVIGAAYNSTADHAWNMVRLDGEWYCVDVTWNNSYQDAAFPSDASHRYFNTTSQWMRDTDHQWDYRNVPEATADVYRWDNVK